MAAATLHIDVVSAEESIYSGEAEFVVLPGEAGELGVYPRHTPLITRIRAGAVRIKPAGGGEEDLIFVAGGLLEVQPTVVTVLADTAIRGADSPKPSRSSPAKAPVGIASPPSRLATHQSNSLNPDGSLLPKKSKCLPSGDHTGSIPQGICALNSLGEPPVELTT